MTEQRPLSAEALSDACIEAELLLCEKRWYHEVISRPFIRTGFFYFTGNSIGEFRWDTLLNKNKKKNGGFYDSI